MDARQSDCETVRGLRPSGLTTSGASRASRRSTAPEGAGRCPAALQETVGQDAAFEYGVELILDENSTKQRRIVRAAQGQSQIDGLVRALARCSSWPNGLTSD